MSPRAGEPGGEWASVHADDGGLARSGEQGAVLGPEMDEAVPEATGDGVHADVEQDPLRRHEPDHPQRVVEAPAPAGPPRGLAYPERDVVTEDGEPGGRGLQELGHPGPQRAAAIAGTAVDLDGLPS